METEPIFCPCCGGVNIVFAEYTTNKGAIICRDCNLKLVAHGDHTGGWRKNATKKWNARVERTCEDAGEGHDFACSECGARLYTETTDGYTMILGDEMTILLKPRHCPNCGAKVVEE